MQEQDSSHPTGVAGPVSGRDAGGKINPGNSTGRARTRKANAALELRLGGASWQDIARMMGYPSARAALVATEKALERNLLDHDRDKLRDLVSSRLDRLLRGVWPKAIDPENPEQLPAVGKSRELIADFRKLHGLDAPTEVVVTSPSQRELDDWVARVISQEVPDVPSYDVIEGEVIDEEPPRALPA